MFILNGLMNNLLDIGCHIVLESSAVSTEIAQLRAHQTMLNPRMFTPADIEIIIISH